VRALLEGGADPTITDVLGRTPMATAKQSVPGWLEGVAAEGRREGVAALQVRPVFLLLLLQYLLF
jgi:hypothetical protein